MMPPPGPSLTKRGPIPLVRWKNVTKQKKTRKRRYEEPKLGHLLRKFPKTENVRFRTAKPIIPAKTINPYRQWCFFEPFFSAIIVGAASSRKWSSISGKHGRPKLASGFGFPHIVGGTSVQMSQKQQHSSTTSRICPVLLCPVPPRAGLRHHHEPMESDSDGVDYESLASVLAVAIAAFPKFNHSLSRRGQGQSVSGRV